MSLKEIVEKIFDEVRTWLLVKKITVIIEDDMGVTETFSREWK